MKTKPFNLEQYLADPSQKVVTRDGRDVRIICTDRIDSLHPIIALIYPQDCSYECAYYFAPDGTNRSMKKNQPIDLFFADESEDELTEFERELRCVIEGYQQKIEREEVTSYTQRDNYVKEEANNLLDIARKELEKDNVIIDKDKYLKICDKYYDNGKKNALKDLPRWKKFCCGIAGNCDRDVFLIRNDDGTYYTSKVLSSNCVYLELRELEKLPKEELINKINEQ